MSSRIERALQAIDRKNFVPLSHQAQAHKDIPLPLGYGQTISQPHTVHYMLHLLHPRKGDHTLDVGAGSGWTTALLAYLVGPRGRVVGVERIPQLTAFGQANLARYDFAQATLLQAGKQLGYPPQAPYDRILVSAAAKNVPTALWEQLSVGGILVLPVNQALWKVSKKASDVQQIEKHEGFAFVPLMDHAVSLSHNAAAAQHAVLEQSGGFEP